ncbi:GntR family transcriptional regulator [Micromonospora sp. RL09-050-HVF-A]|uniref:GntR family transcriptional regulator n=1 Tax=Micromonospora sp. RL09-050-HVF-A TaxID=1703433 RepID=UPI001C5ECDAA|nr:GntR family transcriptional regulator [Micromonospora sp. RL09-050-HVF-A]MBW4704047.1 GntR family transcriptional regulator [Micromonospora sp. RL09-050-HVF-A]
MPTPHYGQPRYRTIADELKQRIERGAIPPGAVLPTESVLTAEFRASRGTIRQAISVLRDEGFVTTEHGRGTYANARTCNCNTDRCKGTKERVNEVAADAGLAALFEVEVGTPLIESESISRTGARVEMVVRLYRLPRHD